MIGKGKEDFIDSVPLTDFIPYGKKGSVIVNLPPPNKNSPDVPYKNGLTKNRSGRPKKNLNHQELPNGLVVNSSLNGFDNSLKADVVALGDSRGTFNGSASIVEGSGDIMGSFKPRQQSKTSLKPPPNPQKCVFSPYSYHRWARAHKEKMKDGTIAMILRCRYCIEFQQVLIRFKKDKDGRYVAYKEIMPLGEMVQAQ